MCAGIGEGLFGVAGMGLVDDASGDLLITLEVAGVGGGVWDVLLLVFIFFSEDEFSACSPSALELLDSSVDSTGFPSASVSPWAATFFRMSGAPSRNACDVFSCAL